MRARPDRRPSPSRRGYGRDWQRLRRWFLANAAGLRCGICHRPFALADLTTKGAIHVDHVEAIADGGARLDPANLRPAHAACHNRRTAHDQGKGKGKARGCDIHGNPLGDHPWNTA